MEIWPPTCLVCNEPSAKSQLCDDCLALAPAIAELAGRSSRLAVAQREVLCAS